jgi:hypothetical protein
VVHDWPPVGWGVLAGVTVYAVCYAAACLGLAGWVFRRKRF